MGKYILVYKKKILMGKIGVVVKKKEFDKKGEEMKKKKLIFKGKEVFGLKFIIIKIWDRLCLWGDFYYFMYNLFIYKCFIVMM